jgi:hypothetical protein
VSLDLWILGVFLCVVCCNLFKLGAMWCAFALWKVRAVELMKVVWNSSWFLEMARFARDASE